MYPLHLQIYFNQIFLSNLKGGGVVVFGNIDMSSNETKTQVICWKYPKVEGRKKISLNLTRATVRSLFRARILDQGTYQTRGTAELFIDLNDFPWHRRVYITGSFNAFYRTKAAILFNRGSNFW